jgi:hypothetical protein
MIYANFYFTFYQSVVIGICFIASTPFSHSPLAGGLSKQSYKVSRIGSEIHFNTAHHFVIQEILFLPIVTSSRNIHLFGSCALLCCYTSWA